MWGITWGDSWGDSWGPLHPVEEHPENYSVGSPGAINTELRLLTTLPGRRRRVTGREEAKRRHARIAEEEILSILL